MKPCKACGTPFEPTAKNHQYCSRDCRPSDRVAYPDGRRKCATCGRGFTRTSWAQRYCSATCRVSSTAAYAHRKYLARRATPPGPRGGSKPDLEKRAANIATATVLRAQGLRLAEIGRRMGLSRGRVCQLLKTGR